MAIKLREAFKSRPGNWRSAERTKEQIYHVFGSDDDVAIEDHVEANTDTEYDVGGGVLLPRASIETEQIAPLQWLARVLYSGKEKETGDSVFQFDTTGGTAHVTQSRQTLRTTADAPDMGGAINVSEDRVDGTDITIPSFSYSETHYIDAATVTLGYVRTLSQITGATNDATFKGWAAGEVLFLGATGTLRDGEGDWEITFNFDMSQNENITVAGLGSLLKEGWAYLWVLYRDAEDQGQLIKTPKAAYVEQVYPEADFSNIGIGT